MRTVLGVGVSEITVPIFSGQNITVIAETIASNHLLRIDGYHAAQEFNKCLLRCIQARGDRPERRNQGHRNNQ